MRIQIDIVLPDDTLAGLLFAVLDRTKFAILNRTPGDDDGVAHAITCEGSQIGWWRLDKGKHEVQDLWAPYTGDDG